jgi:hypothetical protein
MEPFVPLGSAGYFAFLGLVLLARGADFLSTWVATPHLLLEANPLARALGWRWGVVVNVVLALAVAMWPLPAIMVTTASALVAARNFQSAWLARSMGEGAYRAWLGGQLACARRGLFLVCLAGQVGLVAAVAALLILFSAPESVAFAVGLGILAYAFAVLIFTLIGTLRLWRERGEPT